LRSQSRSIRGRFQLGLARRHESAEIDQRLDFSHSESRATRLSEDRVVRCAARISPRASSTSQRAHSFITSVAFLTIAAPAGREDRVHAVALVSRDTDR